ncbi:HGGxSTG domain-containing protein [Paenibacillus koleovorans]|uniref:HGGxSTG domain-containing protein n=1 Tax=Paenibacillus koleovorans TaxID=121608 RepID=UPI000FDAA50B|nr:HGGxSTG domain-containing protein [Paenibacillus koleovorans]
MMRGQKYVCGARTRSGTSCNNLPMKNGRCRLHGGKSKGPNNPAKLRGNRNAVGNKAALTTGEYETITWETLTEEEKGYLREQYRLQPDEQIDFPFEMESIRVARMMRRANQWDENSSRYFEELIAVENAITRVSGRMLTLVAEMNGVLPSDLK